jgi:hypothetical protein
VAIVTVKLVQKDDGSMAPCCATEEASCC